MSLIFTLFVITGWKMLRLICLNTCFVFNCFIIFWNTISIQISAKASLHCDINISVTTSRG